MRTHYCGQINESLENQEEITVVGWVNRRRDHGGVIFVDLRDREGTLQVVFDPDDPDMFAQAETLRNEFVIQVTGKVRLRPEGTTNPELPTGMVEMLARKLEIVNKAKTPPFVLDDDKVNEDVRLKYRYLDLRRPHMQNNLVFRSKVTSFVRRYLDEKGFLDIETPVLTKATPEGARDYLVPSRVHEGHFYALPQSPQLFKQLLMMSGFDRYYQIVKCFRDEDLRADRQPEFTQIDIETSFLDEEQIMHLNEDMVRGLYKELLDIDLPDFPRMTYAEAMEKYGSDRPDLRTDLELVDVADLMETVEFKVFAGPASDPKGRVAALRVPQGGELSRKQIDDYTKFVSIYGAKGLAYIKVNDMDAGVDGLQSPILKFLGDEVALKIMERVGAQTGDIVFFGADKATVVNEALGALRVKVAEELGQLSDKIKPLWVVDFPMFEYDEDAKRYTAVHHPFTAPKAEDLERLEEAPEAVLSCAYDMVINGTEVGGGSIRIHNPELQARVLKLLGIDAEEAGDKFGFLLDALSYGTPPHGGLAFGLDRLVMLMLGANTIREVMAFPKTQSASDVMTAAPSTVDENQLKELSLRIRQAPKIAE